VTPSVKTRNAGSGARINVSIINYRTAELTMQCVRSVLEDGSRAACMVTIVDNASGDGSVDTLRAFIAALPDPARVQLVVSPTNSGFSGGHNQGIAACDAPYHLVLNSDAVLKPGFLDAILGVAEAHPECGLIAPRIDYDDGTRQISCFRFPTPKSELIRGAASGPITRLLQSSDVPLDNPPDPAQVEWASFACILLRDDMIRQIGPMDEGYFLYFEDVEYSWRARRAGWRICLAPEACAVHFRGGSGPVKASQAARKRLPAYYYASRTRVLYQMHGRAGLLMANLMWHLGRGVAQLRRLAGKPVPPATAHEARDIWINVLTPLGDRRDS